MSVTPLVYGNARVSYDSGGAFPVLGLASQVTGRRLADFSQTRHLGLRYASTDRQFSLDRDRPHPASRIVAVSPVSADYLFTTTNPYAAFGASNRNQADLVPVNRATLLFGLQYGF